MRRLAWPLVACLVAAAGLVPAQPEGAASTWVWSGADGSAAAGVSSWLAGRDHPVHVYPHLGMVSFVASASVAHGAVDRFGGRVDADRALALHLDKSVPYIGAADVKREVGLARTGPSVLVIDTGVDSTHPDFQAGNLAANVQAERVGGLVLGTLEQLPVLDASGHGTHVAGIVAGSGAALGASDPLRGRYTGVYSVGRVVGYQASTLPQPGDDIGVDIIAALEAFDWALANQERYDIRVVTNSWGDAGDFDPDHPVNQATRRLYLHGMVVVFSAGNAGEDGAGRLNTYCVAPWVLCVAAGDLDDARLSFSSYGRPEGEGRPWEHPDLTAPGLLIHSANPAFQLEPVPALGRLAGGEPASRNLYHERSGTSMAAPHVAGAAALLLASRPDLSPDEVMDLLTATARPMADPVRKVGAGYLDVGRAYAVAQAAPGALEEFLAGQAVKYAGPATGDPEYARDAVSVGYDGAIPDSVLALPGRDRAWLLSPLAWVLLGTALLFVALGVGFRR